MSKIKLTLVFFLGIELHGMGQCFIDKNAIAAFITAFPFYHISHEASDPHLADHHSDYRYSMTYYGTSTEPMDSVAENEIFYDVIYTCKGEKEAIVRNLKSSTIDSISAIQLADYIICKHKQKYLESRARRKEEFVKTIKSGQIDVDTKVFFSVDENPEFPGGQEGLLTYFSANLQYPKAARKSKVEGMVLVKIIIDRQGNIMSSKISRSLGYGCDEEALRLLKKMPKWKPGSIEGIQVNTFYMIPVVFKLD